MSIVNGTVGWWRAKWEEENLAVTVTLLHFHRPLCSAIILTRAFPQRAHRSSSCLEEKERDTRAARISFAPASHPVLSHGSSFATSSARAGVVARPAHVVTVCSVGRRASASWTQPPEVQIELREETRLNPGTWMLLWNALLFLYHMLEDSAKYC